MAVLEMQKVSLCALKKNRKQILEILQRRGVIELSDVLQEDTVFKKTDTSHQKNVLEKSMISSQQALDVLNTFEPEKASALSVLEGKKAVSVDYYNKFSDKCDEMMRLAYQLTSLSKKISENKSAIPKIKAQIESLTPWLNLDIPMNLKGTKYTTVFIGTFQEETNQEDILARLKEFLPQMDSIYVELISVSRSQTCALIICLKNDAEQTEEALRNIGFSRPAFMPKVEVSSYCSQLEEKIEKLEQESEDAINEIKSYADKRDIFKFMVDYYAMRLEKYELISHLMQSKRVFILTGYIPKRDAVSLESEITKKFNVAIEFKDPSSEDDIPVLLQNNSFVAPVEPVLEGYSLPGRGEVDPCSVMAIFYYVLFGMMLSDAAYGLIMSLVCGIILFKYRNIESGLRKTIQMFFYCGISTTFWGVMFGSYFGDVVDVVSQTFFGTHLTIPPVWFIPVNEPMRLLVFSFLLGIIHLFTGLGVQFYQLVRAKKYKDALYDVVFWYLLVGGGIIYLLTMPMFTEMVKLNFVLPPFAGKIASICAGIGAVGIIATAGRDSKNPIKRLLKGLYGLYNVSGYLSDILSYSRLLALGLATGVIANVFNKMGSMAGNGIVGIIVFILVFVIGHTMNIGINLLGAYVHTNRLQYVEFFGKFYQGGGRKFKPFAVKTKYYKFKEEN